VNGRRTLLALAGCFALACSEKDTARIGRLGGLVAGPRSRTGTTVSGPGWTAGGSAGFFRVSGSATLLSSGKVLLAGGLDGDYSAELYDPATGTFQATGSMLIGRAYHAATLLPDGRVLVAGGSNSTGGSLADTELYDPATEIWQGGNPMVRARAHLTATLLPSGKVLVAGGLDAELYDPGTTTWSLTGPLVFDTGSTTVTLLRSGQVLAAGGSSDAAQLYDPASDTWRATGRMSAPRQDHLATLLPSGEVLVAGGRNPQTGKGLVTAELYDPSAETWSATGDSLLGWGDASATLLPSGEVLVTAGQDSELYDPSPGTWRSAGPMGDRHYYGTATLLPSGKVLRAGGQTFLAELFDPLAGAWRTAPPQAVARTDGTATVLPGGKVLVAGGRDGSGPLASAALYDPAAGTWAPTGAMASERARHTATLLPGGKVLVAGGDGPAGPTTSVEVYDPGLGTWSATGPLATGRSGHTATLLSDRRVLVAGGDGAGPLASAELYRPSASTWRTAGGMAEARAGHTATLLPDGAVLVAGGEASAQILSSAELYDPASDVWTSAGAMFSPRAHHTATAMRTGLVLFVGGQGVAGPLLDVEQYSHALGTWRTAPSMALARSRHTATLLSSGKLLVTGGMGSAGPLAGAEVFDEADRTWSTVASLVTARADAAAVLLPASEVLVTGGSTAAGAALASAELYEDTGASAAWRPAVATPPPGSVGNVLTVTGDRFRGISEASSGCIDGNSASNVPVVRLSPLQGGPGVAARLQHFTSTSISLLVPPLPDGHYVLSVTANGSSGGNVTFIDGPPMAPALTGPASAVSSLTPAVTGRAEAGNAVAVLVDGSPLGSVAADADGAWSVTPSSPLAEGYHEAVATATDPSGHTSTSLVRPFVVDVTAPPAPAFTGPPPVVNTSRPNITGSGEPASTVTVWLDGTLAGTETVDPGGTWSLVAPELTQGTHTVVARASDPAGNTSGVSPARSFVVDSVAPPAPVLSTPPSGVPLSTARPIISGTAEGGSTVTVALDGSTLGTVQADLAGTWSLTPTAELEEGLHLALAYAEDAAGNVGPPSGLRPFIVDTMVPAPPTFGTPVSGAVLATTTPVVSGMAEGNSILTVMLDDAVIGSTQADGAGSWSLRSPDLAQGTHVALARAADPAGNLSSFSEPSVFSVDTVAPAAPSIATPANGAFVNTATPVISGWSEVQSTAMVMVDATQIGSPVAGSTGSWSVASPDLADGLHIVTVRSVDAAGNSGDLTSGSFTVDTVAPRPPTLEIPESGTLVRTLTPRLRGTVEAGCSVTIVLDGSVVGTASGDELAPGVWSFTPPGPLEQGLHRVVLQATDEAGNASPPSDQQSFTIQKLRSYYGTGCSAAPGASGEWWLLLALGALARGRWRPGLDRRD